jgi:hypothetical protein
MASNKLGGAGRGASLAALCIAFGAMRMRGVGGEAGTGRRCSRRWPDHDALRTIWGCRMLASNRRKAPYAGGAGPRLAGPPDDCCDAWTGAGRRWLLPSTDAGATSWPIARRTRPARPGWESEARTGARFLRCGDRARDVRVDVAGGTNRGGGPTVRWSMTMLSRVNGCCRSKSVAASRSQR